MQVSCPPFTLSVDGPEQSLLVVKDVPWLGLYIDRGVVDWLRIIRNILNLAMIALHLEQSTLAVHSPHGTNVIYRCQERKERKERNESGQGSKGAVPSQ